MNMNKYICKCSQCQITFNTMNTEKEDFIRSILPAITFSYLRDDVNITLSLVQAIHESYWGTSKLAREAKNIFGVKWRIGCGYDKFEKMTNEYIDGKMIKTNAYFVKYKSWNESIVNHGVYLATRIVDNKLNYEKVIENKNNYKKTIEEVFKAKYATDKKYVSSLLNTINYYNLYNLEKCIRSV